MGNFSVGLGLFVYNRPDHTRIVLESLKKNRLSKLYVFADAPKNGQMTAQVEATRQLVRAIDWCDVEIIEHAQNKGNVPNLIFGIQHMLNNHDAAIVLEDDCEVRPDYYAFMTRCLDFYKDDKSIFHVNGYHLPVGVGKDRPWDVYRSPHATSWGYGLWKRSWAHFRMDVNDAREYFRTPQARRILEVVPNLRQRMDSMFNGVVDSFIYRWNFIINRYGGSCVSPYRSFVRNIGWDGQGVHCGKSKRYNVSTTDWERPVSVDFRLPKDPASDPSMDVQVSKFFTKKPEILFKAHQQWQIWRKGLARR